MWFSRIVHKGHCGKRLKEFILFSVKLKLSKTVKMTTLQLVSGSSGTQQTDEDNNDASNTDVGKGDGYTEGIPGPVTRLFVLANRGLANLVQDLILVSF